MKGLRADVRGYAAQAILQIDAEIDEKEIDILCPLCGSKHKGKLEEADDV